MKVFTYIWKYKYLTIVITLMLLTQSFLGFSIPFFTSKIIDTGIQQSGVEYAVPQKLTNLHFNDCMRLAENNEIINNSYDKTEENIYSLNENGYQNINDVESEIECPISYINKNEKPDENYQNYKDSFYKNNLHNQIAISATKTEMINAGCDIWTIQVNYLVKYGSFMLIVSLLYALLMFSASSLIAYVSVKIGKEKRQQAYQSAMYMSNSDIDKLGEGSLMVRITNNIQNIQDLTEILLRVILYAPITIIVGCYFAITTAAQLSWIIVLAAIGIIVGAIIFRKFIIEYFRRTQTLLDKVNAHTRQILSGLYVIRAFNNENIEESKFDRNNKTLYKYQLITGRVTSIIPPAMTFACNIMSIVIILFGQFLINIGEIQVGGIIAFTSYLAIVVDAFSQLGRFIGKIPQANVAINRVEEIINSTPNNNDYHHSKHHPEKSDKYKIEFRNVCFSYDNSNNYVLNNINACIHKGETIGIIGTVGSGKTTLLKLLFNLYRPTKGQIFIDEKPIEEVDSTWYKNLFSYSPQQSFLFSGTVKEILEFGRNNKDEKLSDDQAMEYIKIAHADDFIKTKNDLNKYISQDSKNISGGQKQRLSIARTLAAERDILIFDDSFSAIDYTNEEKILASLKECTKGKTKIIISQRISSIINADKILVLHDSNIVGIGSHEQLIKSCDEYIKIAKSQMDKIT